MSVGSVRRVTEEKYFRDDEEEILKRRKRVQEEMRARLAAREAEKAAKADERMPSVWSQMLITEGMIRGGLYTVAFGATAWGLFNS